MSYRSFERHLITANLMLTGMPTLDIQVKVILLSE